MWRASRGLPAKKVRSFSKISTARNPAFAAAGSLPSSAPPALKRSIAAADLDWEARVVGAHHKLSKVEELVDSERASQLLADHILKAAQMAEREGAAPLEASINATVLGF